MGSAAILFGAGGRERGEGAGWAGAGGRSDLGSRLEHSGRLRFPAFLVSPPTTASLARPRHTTRRPPCGRRSHAAARRGEAPHTSAWPHVRAATTLRTQP